MTKPWEENIRKVVPYVPGEQPKGERLIKLNTNENPYPPAPNVAAALEQMEIEKLRRYPDPTASDLVCALTQYYGLEKDQVFVGVGSDDVLGMAFLTYFHSRKPILFPDITYSFYPVWANLFGIPYKTRKLDDNFYIRPEDYFEDNGGVIFPNPNAPTGLYLPLEQVEEILKHNQSSVVIVDEAYIDFGGVSARTLLDRYENLLVVQTFSKSRSMAGVRIGYAFGSPELLKAMENVKYSYNSYTMNLPSIVLGVEALKNRDYFTRIIDKIVKTRERAKDKFRTLGFHCLDSSANFLFMTHEKKDAKQILEALRSNQIYVRHFDGPRLSDYLRVTIGTDEEMETVYEFLASYLRLNNEFGSW